MSKLYIKNDRWNEFCEKAVSLGFTEQDSHYFRYGGNKRIIYVWKYDRSVIDYKLDSTTYWGTAYEGEFRHRVKYYAKDLIDLGFTSETRE